ncbi:Nucleolar complex protein 3 [Glugoides intestinalis]
MSHTKSVEKFSQAQINLESAERIASISKRIINNPESNIDDLSILLEMKENKGLLLLSLAKVFKSIVPLYKIRLHSSKVKHITQDLSVTEFDRKLFTFYNTYIREICSSDTLESFRSAAELLRTLDHFNFADRLIAKVLLGTMKSPTIAKFCIEAVIDRIKNDQMGETVFMIIDKCLDYKFSNVVVEALLESKFIEKCVEIRINKEEYYTQENIEKRKHGVKDKGGKGFFARKYIIDKKLKKEEKKRLKLQKEAREVEKQELDPIIEKNYVRTVNALQRLYFTILSENYKACFKDTFIGVRKYIKVIRKEFHEGLYTLLTNKIKISDTTAALEGVRTVFEIYNKSGYDFKVVLDTLFRLVSPFNYEIERNQIQLACNAIRYMFVDIIQPKQRVAAIMHRILKARLVRFVPEFDKIVKDLEVRYDICFTDFDMKDLSANELDCTDIDKAPFKPFYEYFIFKKMH